MSNNIGAHGTIKRNLQKIEKYAMGISEESAKGLITKVQDEIAAQKNKQQLILPDLNAAKEMYEKLQNEYDGYQAIVSREEHTLQALVGFMTHDAKHKTIKVYKQMDNNEASQIKKTRKSHRVRRPWKNEFMNTLQKEQKFMSGVQLYNAIVEKHPDWKFASDNERDKTIRWYLEKNIREGNVAGLIMFKDKIGLPGWMNGTTIHARFAPQFMG